MSNNLFFQRTNSWAVLGITSSVLRNISLTFKEPCERWLTEDSTKNRTNRRKCLTGWKILAFPHFFLTGFKIHDMSKNCHKFWWNLKNDKSSIPRLLVIRIQFWKKVVVELFCFRPKIYLSISTSWVGSSRNRDSFLSVNF